MALTGLDIYKKLPKQNCKECGLPTCLAFAMKVAAGQVGLDQCPRLTDEARGELGDAECLLRQGDPPTVRAPVPAPSTASYG